MTTPNGSQLPLLEAHSAVSGVADQGWHIAQAGRGDQLRVGLAVLAQDSEQATHLDEYRAACGLDGGQRFLGLAGVGLDDVVADSGLHGDHAHGVSDDVVKLPCDPQTLFDHSFMGSHFPFPLEELVALLQCRPACTSLPQVVSTEPGDDSREQGGDLGCLVDGACGLNQDGDSHHEHGGREGNE